MYCYQAFELSINSELPFPELLPSLIAELDDKDQITIKWGEVNPQGLDSSISQGLFYQASTSELWLNVPTVARFLIANGKQITIDPVLGVDEDSLRLFVLGSCMGALLMQRNFFLLHGNAVKINEHCISFVGHSGAGKSTLSGAFFKRGYSILADDICAITTDGHVVPSFPQVKLWFDAAKHLNLETTELRKIRPCIEKFALPLAEQFHLKPLPLKIIYILHAHNKDEFIIETITGMQKFRPLQNNTYRKAYLKGLGLDKNHFSQCAQIANHVELVRITRPAEGFKLDELVDLIEHDLQDRGLTHEPS